MMAQVSRPLIRANICGPLAKLPTLFYTASHSNSFSFVIWGFSWFGNSESLTPSQIALIFKKTTHNFFLPSLSQWEKLQLELLEKVPWWIIVANMQAIKNRNVIWGPIIKTQHLKHAEQHLDRPDLYGEQKAQLFGHIYWRYIYRSIDIYTYIYSEKERGKELHWWKEHLGAGDIVLWGGVTGNIAWIKGKKKISLPISKFRMQMSCDRAKEVQLKKWLTSARRQRSTHETQAEAFNSTCPQVLFISLNKSKWQECINMWRIHFWCAFAAGVVFIGLQFKNQQKYAIRRRVPNPFAYNCMTYADRCKWGGGKKERGGRKK